MRTFRIVGLSAVIILLFVANSLTQENTDSSNHPDNNEDANACYEGGTMAGRCNDDSNGDGIVSQEEIDWAWRCGWYLIRYETGIYERDELPADCIILLPRENIGETTSDSGEIVIIGGGGDTDGDGLSDAEEIGFGTNPLIPDTDGDNLTDGDEVYLYGTNPLTPDTDGDGLDDDVELNAYFLDPTDPDTDNDGLTDGEEVNGFMSPTGFVTTNPNNPDTDNDTANDAVDAAPTNPAIQ